MIPHNPRYANRTCQRKENQRRLRIPELYQTGNPERHGALLPHSAVSPIKGRQPSTSAVDISLPCLAAQFPDIERIFSAVFYKMCPTLPELKMDPRTDTLLSDSKHPFIIKRPGVPVRLTSDNDQFYSVQILPDIDSLNQRLADNILMPDRERLK